MGYTGGGGSSRTTILAPMDDQQVLSEISQRQAFVTHEVLQEGEGDVIPPWEKCRLSRYIKAHNIGTYVACATLFALAVIAPQFDYLEGLSGFLKSEPVILCLVPGIVLAISLAQFVKATTTNSPHFILGGTITFQAAVLLIIFTFFGLNIAAKYLIFVVASWLYILQFCQDWEFKNMLVKFQRMLQAGHGQHHQRAREGDEVLNQPVFGGMLNLVELKWLFGCNAFKTRGHMAEEEETNELWGNFRLKDTPEHTREQLILAYRLALDSNFSDVRPAPGGSDPRTQGSYEAISDPMSRMMMYLEGLTCNLTWITSFVIAGLEIGELVFGTSEVSDTPRLIAVCLVGATVFVFLTQVAQTQKNMSRALGVGVAEKEWMAIDVLERPQDRKRLREIAQNAGQRTRTNLTYFWLSAAACSDYLGLGLTCKLCSNCALMTKVMFETGTAYEFVGFTKSRWELLSWANVMNSIQLLILSMMAVVYFGTYAAGDKRPLFWGTYTAVICTAGITMRMRESVRLWRDVETVNSSINSVLFSIAVIFMLVMLICITCLVPIILGNGDLFGSCDVGSYSTLFPELCKNSVRTSKTLYWIVLGVIGAGLGFAGGVLLAPGANMMFRKYRHPERSMY
eukprot:TRINITY_DN94522_c0_g1_i1.p1 TRINITY_DN94522_c0_g1~~TRINITY_DN94522_c0_g1_i1.p1  ORF type:complete len:672 (+),score=122.91 TRINITY_DN94522_c0_g1_i1:142-2016(+)